MNLQDSRGADNDSSALFTDSVTLLKKPGWRSSAGGHFGGLRFALQALQLQLLQTPELMQPEAERHHEKPDKLKDGPQTG
jgi:hypothetical protein